MDETFRFTYSNGETNESVWPGESMHTLTGLFPPKTGGYYYGKLTQKDEHKARLYQDLKAYLLHFTVNCFKASMALCRI